MRYESSNLRSFMRRSPTFWYVVGIETEEMVSLCRGDPAGPPKRRRPPGDGPAEFVSGPPAKRFCHLNGGRSLQQRKRYEHRTVFPDTGFDLRTLGEHFKDVCLVHRSTRGRMRTLAAQVAWLTCQPHP